MDVSLSGTILIHDFYVYNEILVDNNGNFKFPETSIPQLYPGKGIKARMLTVRQFELNHQVKGLCIRQVYLLFIIPKDVQQWKHKGFYYVHFSYVDIMAHP